MRLRVAVASLAFAVMLAPAEAQELSGTLKKIKDSGTISLGHRESSIPFSYYDDKQQVVGYSHELMLKAVDAVKKELKLPNLQVKLTPVTSQNRIPLDQFCQLVKQAEENSTVVQKSMPEPVSPQMPS